MPDTPNPEPPPSEPPEATPDPRKIMRDRADAARKQRDDSIARLRATMDDEAILDEFGIDLGEIER